MDQAQSLIKMGNNRLRQQPLGPQPKYFDYDLSKLVDLPNEIKYKIFSNLEQKSLEVFLHL